MEFRIFIKKLKKVLGGNDFTYSFTKTIFEMMVNEEGFDLLDKISPDTYKAYFNGNTSISKVASTILSNLDEDDKFVFYIDRCGDQTAQVLADEFKEYIPNITAANVSIELKELFLTILREASDKKRVISKKDTRKPGMVSADASDDQLSSVIQEVEQVQTYSSEDSVLLEEFISDYDDIMLSLFREDYSFALLENTNLSKIKDLYESKWMAKADRFQDPTLKSYVFGLLGELNKINDRFSSNINIRRTRMKIQNYYAKLHLGPNTEICPYDAFIDNWNEGEF